MLRCAAIFLAPILWAASSMAAQPEMLHRMSVVPQFTSHNQRGERIVPYFTHGGGASVKQHFVRLASRPNQRGTIWSRAVLGAADFSVEWTYRVGGSSQSEALGPLRLLVAAAAPSGGSAALEKFLGVAVIVDGYRETVRLVVGDGSRSLAAFETAETEIAAGATAEAAGMGCKAELWQPTVTHGFAAGRVSRLRTSYSSAADALTLEIDARGNGAWQNCAATRSLGLPPRWAVVAALGAEAGETAAETGAVTPKTAKTAETAYKPASLSALGVNHCDLVSLRAFSDSEGVSLAVLALAPLAADVTEAVSGAAEGVAGKETRKKEVDGLMHHLEHELSSVEERLTGAVDRLRGAGGRLESRLDALEEAAGTRLLDELETRISALEIELGRSMTAQLGRRLERFERTVSRSVETRVEPSIGAASRGGEGPFLTLTTAVAAFFLISWFKYRELRKEHIL